MKLRYGTRGSALALAQSDLVARALRRADPSLDVERVVIRTSGDLFSQRSPSGAAVAAENVKAMFVKEIEEALLAETIDFAVHSSKDLPGALPDPLRVAAFPSREEPRDAYVGGAARRRADLRAGDVVATTSPRRRIQLGMAVPGVRFVPMRGNIDTRLRKLAEGAAAGLVLASAGLRRLGAAAAPHEILPLEVMVPAPGQGALAVEVRADRADILRILSALDDPRTRLEVECERTFLRLMGGDCRTPLGANASIDGGRLRFSWFWSEEDGANPRKGTFDCDASPAAFEGKAADLARALRTPSKRAL